MLGNTAGKAKLKVGSLAIVLALLVGLASMGAAQGSSQETLSRASAIPVWDVSVYIDDVRLHLDDPPRIQDGRTLVPMRHFFEGLGAAVSWESVDRVASGTRDGIEVNIPIGSRQPTVQGQVVPIAVVAQIFEGRTYIPLRFVGEAFGDDVNWDGDRRRIDIYTGEPSEGLAHYSKTFEPKYNLSYPETWRLQEEPGAGGVAMGDHEDVVYISIQDFGETFEGMRLNSKYDVMDIGSLMYDNPDYELHDPELTMMGNYEVVMRTYERLDRGYRGMLIALERRDGDFHLFTIEVYERGQRVADQITTVLDSFQPVY